MARKPRGKGMRTAYLKAFSARYINTGSSPNPIMMHEWYQRQRDAMITDLKVVQGTFQKQEELDKKSSDKINKVCLRAGKRMRIWYCFAGTQHFFVDQDLVLNKERRSIIYPTREIAYTAFQREQICWINTK